MLDQGMGLWWSGNHVRAQFGALAEVELTKGAGALAANQQRLQDLGQGSLHGTETTGYSASDEEVRTHSAGNTPSSSRTPPW